MKIQEWLLYALLAGLAWGTYVPIIFYGGTELGGKPGARMVGILCVGVAYFVIGVIVPAVLFLTGLQKWSEVNLNVNGLIFSGLAGVAGAVGAICVVFATKAAFKSAADQALPLATYKVYIAPIIFGLAPIINVLVAMVWHPKPGSWLHFGFEMPGWKLIFGIILVGAGAALVLFSKEEAEAKKPKAALVAPKPASAQAMPLPTEKPHG
ncbi:MAG TPA: hypothetical protein VKS79_05625 [Gemmataceae bacterium]|nr:hypothetical protein [Gemmataceae bacterium]